MKRWIALMMAGGVVLSASAEMLEQWTFDEPLDTTIENCANSGTAGTTFYAQDFERYSTDGEGNLLIKPIGGGYAQTSAFPTGPLSGAGTYSLEMKIAEWDIAPGETKSTQLNYRLGIANSPEINIRAILDIVDGLKFTFIVDGGGYRTFTVGGLSGSNVTARIDFNVNEGSADCYIDDVFQTGFTGKTLDIDAFLLQKQTAPLDPNTVFKLDELNLSFAPDDPVVGTYVVDKAIQSDSNAATNVLVDTFDARVGDVIVVAAASGLNAEPDVNSVVIGGGTAVINPVVYGTAKDTAATQTTYWYTTVAADGTVPVQQIHNGTTYWAMGAYQLRGSEGYTAPQLLGDVQGSRFSSTSSISNSYTLGTNYVGVYIEALSAYGGGHWHPENTNTVVSSYGNQEKRNIAVGPFDGLATLDNVWSTTNANQVTLIGLAFGSRPDGIEATPQEQYNAWLAGFSVDPADAGMTDDADGDLLDNLTEYMWGGEPDNVANQGNTPMQSMVNEGGIDYIEYIYYELDDAAPRGLASIFEVGTDLVHSDWVDASGYETGRGASSEAGFDAVTNRIPTDVENKQFIRLQIKLTP